ncbi:branched-chain amino acid ABC transporter permease, partial [bacterium]
MDTGVIASQIINGLVLGFLYVLIAVGLSIICGMLGVVNFAHGALFALGAYFALTLRPFVGDAGVLVVAPLLVAVVGMFIEATMLRPLYDKEPLLGLLLTFGLALFIEELIRTVWGAAGHPFDAPGYLSGFLVFGPILVTKYRLVVLCITALLTFGVWLFLERTPYGRVIRAGSRDPEMVSMLGINLKRVFTLVFGMGTLLAGIAGVLAAPLWSVV